MANNLIDIFILLIFFISIIMGFARGFISEIISLLTLIAAFFVAIMLTAPLAQMFTQSPAVQDVVTTTSSTMTVSTAQSISYLALGLSFVCLFVGTLLIGALVKILLNSIIAATGVLSLGNRLLGGVFGLLRGYVYSICLLFVLQMTPVASSAAWQSSRYVPYFQPAITWMDSMVTPIVGNLKAKIGTTIEGVSTSVKEMSKNI